MSDKRIDDIEKLIEDFQRSGMRELHVRADGFEIYLSNDPDAIGLDAAPQVAVSAPAPAPSATDAASAAPAQSATRAAAAPTSAPASSAGPAADIPDGGVLVKAPYLGTFYRSPKPGSPVYVEVGSAVDPDTEMCLVEVMKLFTAVRAGMAGKVHAILASDGEMVEADQPLFVILPA